MHGRPQRTIRRPVEATGIGFLTGGDVTIRFRPSAPDHGIAFHRTDRAAAPIPARIEFTVPRERRTAIERDGVAVEMIEHVMAALAGLQIDNCLVELNGPEPPGFDGSSLRFAEMLLSAGVVDQAAAREVFVVHKPDVVTSQKSRGEIACRPIGRPAFAITYHLDYGDRSPIQPQELSVEITPETFLRDLAFARTFVLEAEAQALRAAGYGSRTSARDLLIFGADGPIDNELRAVDECVRHKILDCLGDLALLGCDICGHFSADRSGHELNREMVRALLGATDRDAGDLRGVA